MPLEPDRWHRDQYASIRLSHPILPAWDDLTEDQKQRVREANHRQADFMHRLGLAIASGQNPGDVLW